ncbi:DNA-binding transcriptional regulator, GntR family [Amycolatopsis xylanica]|uniref:DNA-binding transcriptional regulator, GntR family n=1 Tax=Amycolatopsis xylanica TaxID=589385 RepID=A0A1H3SVQ6_9PSEU|nr:GntR family transcriptional regulator [Amycolatopsis xylanica]SDZ42086.1 DNA-binding transcriptional regulator, GntR family [Amycolatopsis xylanica]
MQRSPLRQELFAQITARVLDGRLAGRVNEVHLAKELGVSRTPLREALVGLADRGLLISELGRGFLVPPLDLGEARQLYPLVAELESLAVRWTPVHDLQTLADPLDEIADGMSAALAEGAELSAWDDRWHAMLLSRTVNPHLLRLIDQTKPLLKRYDVLYFGGIERSRQSIDEHRQIAAALRTGDLNEACQVLVQNWVKSLGYFEEGRQR